MPNEYSDYIPSDEEISQYETEAKDLISELGISDLPLDDQTAQQKTPLADQHVEDGDTINGVRIRDYDTLESYGKSKKAKKLQDIYGIDLSVQKVAGEVGKAKLIELLQDPQYRDFAVQGVGALGRDLASNDALADEMIRQGVAVPMSRYDRKRQELYRRATEKKIRMGASPEELQAYEAQRTYNMAYEKPGFIDRLGSSVDAFQSGTVQAVGALGDWVGHMEAWVAEKFGADEFANKLRNTVFDEWKKPEVADKMTGYDRREAQFAMDEASSEWDKGNYATAIGIAITTPEVVAESLPIMIETMLGSGKKKITEGIVDTVKNVFSRNKGLLAVVGQESNTHIEEFTKNNDGVEPSLGKTAQIIGTNLLMYSMDRMVFKDIIHAKDTLKAIGQVIPDNLVPELVKKAVGVGTILASAGAKEGAQEYVQTWGEILNVNLGAKGKDLEAVLSDPNLQREARTGAIFGIGAGTQIQMVSQTLGIAKDQGVKAIDKAVQAADAKEQERIDIAASETAVSPAEQIAKINDLVETDTSKMTAQEVKAHNQNITSTFIQAMEHQASLPKAEQAGVEYLQQINNLYIKHKAQTAPTKTDIASATKGDSTSVNKVLGSLSVGFGPSVSEVEAIKANNTLTPAQAATVDNYIRRKTLVDQNTVSKEVLDGVSTGSLGLNVHLATVATATGKKQITAAENAMRFVKQRMDKAKVFAGNLAKWQKNKTAPVVFEFNGKSYEINGSQKSQNLAKTIIDEGTYAEYIGEAIQNEVASKVELPVADQTPKTQTITKEPSETKPTDATKKETPDTAETKPSIIDEISEPKASKVPGKQPPEEKKLSDKQKAFLQSVENSLSSLPEATASKVKDAILDMRSGTLSEAGKKLLINTAKSTKFYTPLDTIGDKVMRNTVVGPNGLNVSQHLSAKSAKGSMFDEYNSIFSDEAIAKVVVERSLAQEQETSLQSLQPLFKGFKEAFLKTAKITDPKFLRTADPISYLRKQDGTFDDNLLASIMLQSYSWLVDNGLDTLANTPESINAILGHDAKDPVSQEAWDLLGDKGMIRNAVANSIGTRVMSDMGLQENVETDGTFAARLATNIGLTAIRTMGRMGLVTESETRKDKSGGVTAGQIASLRNDSIAPDSPDVKVGFVKAKGIKLGNTESQSMMVNPTKQIIFTVSKARAVLDEVVKLDNRITGPVSTPIKIIPTKIKGSPYEIPNKSKKTIEKMQAVKYQTKSNQVAVLRFLGEDAIKEIGGFVKDLDSVHITNKKSVQSKNNELTRDYQHAIEFDSKQGGKPFYFKWTFWKNGRFGMVSNTVNPQNSKMHRAFFGIKSHQTTVTDKNRWHYQQAIAMGLGVKIDKRGKEHVEQEFNRIINDPDIKAAVDDIRTAINNPDLVDPVMTSRILAAVKARGEEYHSLDALVALSNYSADKDFKTNISIETDAVTSGFILTLLQVPILSNTMEWLRKGGISRPEDQITSFGKFSETSLDAYQTGVVELNKVMNKKLMNMTTENQQWFKQKMEAARSLLPEMVEEGKVTSAGRKFLKQPFMTFIYGVSTATMRNALKKEMLAEVYAQIEQGMKLEPTKRNEALFALEQKLRTIIGPSVRIDRQNPLEWVMHPKQVEEFNKVIDSTYGQPLAQAFEGMFGPLIEYRKKMNTTFQTMFDIYEVHYNRKVDAFKQEHSRNPNKAEKTKIVESLRDVFPSISAAFSEGVDDKVAISGTTTNEIVGEDGVVQAQFTEYGDETKSAKGRATEKGYTASISGGPVITIHYTDGSIISEVLNKYEGMGIHDAVNHSINDVLDGSREYSKQTIKISQEYSVMEQTVIAFEKSINSVDAEIDKIVQNKRTELKVAYIKRLDSQIRYAQNDYDKKQLIVQRDAAESADIPTLADDFSELQALADQVETARNELFSGKLRSEHASYIGSMIEYDTDSGEAVNISETAVDEQAPDTDQLGTSKRHINPEEFEASFNREAESENVQTIYETLGEYDKVPVSEKIDTHLRSVLDGIITNGMKHIDPITVKLRQEGDEAFGVYTDSTVYLNVSNQAPKTSVQQSTKEIYVHELVHAITETGLSNKHNFLSKQRLQKLFAIAKSKVTWEDFMHKDSNGNPVHLFDQKSEENAAKEMYNYIFGANPNYLHEFMAYGLTNPQLVAKLETIKAVDIRDTHEGNMLQRLLSMFLNMLDSIIQYGRHEKGIDAQHLLTKLAKDFTHINSSRRSRLNNLIRPVYEQSEKVNKYLAEMLQKTIDKISDPDTVFGKNAKNTLTKSVAAFRNVAKFSDNEKFRKVMSHTLSQIGLHEDGFIRSLAREVAGDKDKYGAWYTLLRQSKKVIDHAREDAASVITKQVNGAFHTELTEVDRIALNSILIEGDLDVLSSSYTDDQILSFLQDDLALGKEILAIKNRLSRYKESNYYIAQAEGLGKYLAVNESHIADQMLNAHNIVTMPTVDGAVVPSNSADIEVLIDQLVTLYAISYNPRTGRNRVAKIMSAEIATDPKENGIRTTMAMHKLFKQESLDKLFKGNKTLTTKGYTREILDPDITIRIAPLTDTAKLQLEGFKLLKPAAKSFQDENPVPMGVFVSKEGLTLSFNKTTASTTDRKATGTTLTEVWQKDGGLFAQYQADINIKKVKLNNSVDVSRQRTGKAFNKETQRMIPLLDEAGNIVDYRYTMSKFTKQAELGKDSRFDIVLGRMFGSIKDKTGSQQINRQIVDMAYDDYMANYVSDKPEFVRLAAKTEPKYAEIYAVLPTDMKNYINHKFGSREIFIRREILDLVFGYRDISAANAAWLKNHQNIRHVVRLAEKIWKEIVAIVKVNIVIKTPVVLIDNIVSNIMISLLNGIPPQFVFKKQYEAIHALTAYKKKQEQRDMIQNRKDSGLDYDEAELTRLSNDLIENPVHPLIEEGLFQSIVEDVNTADFKYKNKTARKIDTISKELLPKPAIAVGKQLYMTEETTLFQFMLKATQYSDFVARYAMYTYMTENQGVSKEESLNHVIDTFINYDVPDHKLLHYLNDIGLVMFTKYFLRIQRIIFKLIKSKPGFATAGIVLQSILGDLADPVDSSPLDTNFGDKLKLDPLDKLKELIIPSNLETAWKWTVG